MCLFAISWQIFSIRERFLRFPGFDFCISKLHLFSLPRTTYSQFILSLQLTKLSFIKL